MKLCPMLIAVDQTPNLEIGRSQSVSLILCKPMACFCLYDLLFAGNHVCTYLYIILRATFGNSFIYENKGNSNLLVNVCWVKQEHKVQATKLGCEVKSAQFCLP